MSIFVSILGLAVLIVVHEAGHFFVARWVGMKPRKFYIGFGAPLVKTVRNGVEYGIGSIPLGGYVKIPGMHRPAPGDLRASLRPDDRERLHEHLERLDEALRRGDEEAARERLRELEPHVGRSRAFQELEGALAEDAYWRQTTWKRIVVIAAGPITNVLLAIVLFTGIYVTGVPQPSRIVGAVSASSPAARAGVHEDDKVVAVAGHRVTPDTLAKRIRATEGRPFTMIVLRDGRRVTIGPLRAERRDGAYRIGIGIAQPLGPGQTPPHAFVSALRVTWDVTSQTISGIGGLIVGRGTDQVSSSVGIVNASSDAFKASFRDFLGVMGLISLALALLNLLPVLPLDGGHIVMSIAERLRGRAFSQSVYMRYAAIGFALFALLLYIGLRNDITNLGG
jgi:regulator of sigma E protease